jgi:hypothetical protein
MHRPIPGAQIGCTCSELCRRGESLSNLGERDRKGQLEDLQSATDDHLMSCEADRITTDWKTYHGTVTKPELCCGRKKEDIHDKTTSHFTAGHCCQIPPGLLGQFSQKIRPLEKKIRPQAGHPRNHQKKCGKKIFLQFFGPIIANYC